MSMVNRRDSLKLPGSGAGNTPAPHANQNVDKRANIIVVVVDDLRWDDIGIAGHPFVYTPNIDRIGYEGARFLNAFCSALRAEQHNGRIRRPVLGEMQAELTRLWEG